MKTKKPAWRCADCGRFHHHSTELCGVTGRARVDAEEIRLNPAWIPAIQQGDDEAMVNALTVIVREADQVFQRVGGSSRHWVRDCFLPLLNAKGFRMSVQQASAEPEVVAAVDPHHGITPA